MTNGGKCTLHSLSAEEQILFSSFPPPFCSCCQSGNPASFRCCQLVLALGLHSSCLNKTTKNFNWSCSVSLRLLLPAFGLSSLHSFCGPLFEAVLWHCENQPPLPLHSTSSLQLQVSSPNVHAVAFQPKLQQQTGQRGQLSAQSIWGFRYAERTSEIFF